MALALVDIDMDLPEACNPKLPVDEDSSSSKEGLCGTPFSQASTAPCTPIRFFLPDPFEVVQPVQPSFSFCVLPLPLSICMSPWWTQYKQVGKPDIVRVPPKRKVWVLKVPLCICLLPWWDQYRQGWKDTIYPVLRIAKPVLKSDLALWAQKVLAAMAQPVEHVLHTQWRAQYRQGWEDPVYAVLRIAKPLLKSELALWAQKVVAAKAQPMERVLRAPRWAQFVRQGWNNSTYHGLHIAKPLLKSELALLALNVVAAKAQPMEHVPRTPWWAQYRRGWKDPTCLALRIAKPSLKSKYAIWAQKLLAMKSEPLEYVLHIPCSQQDYSVLKLMYKLPCPIQEYLACSQQQCAILEFGIKHEYKVDHGLTMIASNAQGVHDEDLVDDADWDIQGASCDVDDDEWLKVDEVQVNDADNEWLKVDVGTDRLEHPLSTSDAHVIALNLGGPVVFSSTPEHFLGHIRKVAPISMAKASSDATAAPMNRSKLFHRKRKHCHVGTISSKAIQRALSINVSGRIFHFNAKKCVKTHRKAQVEAHCGANTRTNVMAIDAVGVVRNMLDPCDDQRGLDVNPGAVLIIDADGMIQTHDIPIVFL